MAKEPPLLLQKPASPQTLLDITGKDKQMRGYQPHRKIRVGKCSRNPAKQLHPDSRWASRGSRRERCIYAVSMHISILTYLADVGKYRLLLKQYGMLIRHID